MVKIVKKNIILLLSIGYLIVFIIGWLVLSYLKYTYLFKFKLISIFIILFGIILGTIKIINSLNCDKKVKIPLYILYILVESIIGVITIGIIIFPLLYDTEKVITIDHEKYVEVTHSFLFSNGIYYYDYENFIYRKTQPRIVKSYDDSLDPDNYLDTVYYDDEGNVIKTTKEDEKISNNEDEKISNNKEEKENNKNTDEKVDLKPYVFEREILYSKTFNDIVIRITKIDVALALKDIIIVEKSTDGGKTFTNQLKEKNLIVGNGAEYLFLKENIGFIKEDKNDLNKGLIVTRDGGKTFEPVNLKVDKETLSYLYVEKMPYYDHNLLKLDISLYYTKKPTIKTMISKDNGLTWEYYEDK